MASSNVNDFRENFLKKQKFQMASRYSVGFFPSSDIGLDHQPDTHVESIVIPGWNLEFAVDEIWGPVRKIPVGREYKYEAAFTIPITNQWDQYTYFSSWMKKLVPLANDKFYARTEYEGPISDSSVLIKPMSTSNFDNINKTIKLNEAYPITLLPVEMAHNLQNIYTNMMVLFAFRTLEEI
jgi:hypothetical protein